MWLDSVLSNKYCAGRFYTEEMTSIYSSEHTSRINRTRAVLSLVYRVYLALYVPKSEEFVQLQDSQEHEHYLKKHSDV